jgi:hypothetical protein
MVDLSLMVKSGVQYSLWGGSVLHSLASPPL